MALEHLTYFEGYFVKCTSTRQPSWAISNSWAISEGSKKTRAVKADVTDKADASALSYGPTPVRFPSDAFRTVRNAQTVDPPRPSRYVKLGSPVGGGGRQKQQSRITSHYSKCPRNDSIG